MIKGSVNYLRMISRVFHLAPEKNIIKYTLVSIEKMQMVCDLTVWDRKKNNLAKERLYQFSDVVLIYASRNTISGIKAMIGLTT